MDAITLRRAVEHLLVGLPLVTPYQLSFSLMSGTLLHRILGYDVAARELKFGQASQLDPVEMASHEQVAGGNYTAWDAEPPALIDEELKRWELVFDAIHTAVHNGKIVRFGADEGGFRATVEDEAGTGAMTLAVHLLWALEITLGI